MSPQKACIIYPFYCTKRGLDAARLVQYFKLNGFQVITDPGKADYNILITCAFKKNRETASLKAVDRLKKYKGELIVCGCLPGTAPEKLKLRFGGKSIPTKDLHAIEEFFSDFKIAFADIPDPNIPYYSSPAGSWTDKLKTLFSFIGSVRGLAGNYLRKILRSPRPAVKAGTAPASPEAHLRIGIGCAGKCSYCVIRRAIGGFCSKPPDECLREYRELIEKGYRRIVINAEDVGMYGMDINSSFTGLLERLSEADPDHKAVWDIRDLSARSGVEYGPKLMEYIRNGTIKQVTLGIQSGSARILRLMNRYDDVAETERVLKAFKQASPLLFMVCSSIIGFPSETTEDFSATMDFIKRVRPDVATLHAYSNMEGSAACKLDRQIDQKEISRRLMTAVRILKESKIRCDVDDI